MRFSSACIVLLSGVSSSVHGFTTQTQRMKAPAFGLGSPRFAAGDTDDYDEWYADFDPSQFDDVAQTTTSSTRGSFGRGGGSSDGSHDYERDVNADNSNVDLAAVNSMIAERLQARKTGQFDRADEIRDTLLNDHGVSIYDKERKWRSGCSASGSGMKWGRNNDRRFNNNDRSRGRKPPARDFGPNGHDYQLTSEAGPNVSSLSESEIHSFIAQRLQCKMSRNFQQADALQQEFEQLGVYVHDGRKEWRADGQRFENFASPSRAQPQIDRFGPYKQSEHSQPTNDVDTIQALLDERVEAKKKRSFDVADEIQQELRRDFNVEINDKTRQWSVGGDFGMGFRDDLAPYRMSDTSEKVPDDNTVPLIQALVEDREKARKRRNYDEADDIRDELREVYNVEVDDKVRQWSIGGQFADQRQQRTQREQTRSNDFDNRGPPPDFVRRGGGSLTEENIDTITQLIADRNDAKRAKQFGKADRIRDLLKDDYQVRVDDRNREWMVVTDEYSFVGTNGVDEAVKAHIEQRIGARALAKLNKDYDVADAIRDELQQEYRVFLDDRVKEWSMEGDASPGSEDDFDATGDDDDANDPMFADLDSALDDVFNHEATGDAAADIIEGSSEDLESLKVDELKDRLRLAGLPVSGKKAELIERLMEAA